MAITQTKTIRSYRVALPYKSIDVSWTVEVFDDATLIASSAGSQAFPPGHVEVAGVVKTPIEMLTAVIDGMVGADEVLDYAGTIWTSDVIDAWEAKVEADTPQAVE